MEKDMSEIKNRLLLLIEQACRQLAVIVGKNEMDDSCHIHIPMIDGKLRISEQELKYAFLEIFIKDEAMKGYKYSVETPTEKPYKFTADGKKIVPECGNGRKANIDVVIFNDYKRGAMIEFKAGNPDEHSHAKDFLKLKEEPGDDLIRIFVELYSTTNDKTRESIQDKLYNNKYGNIGGNTDYLGFSLNHKNKGCCFVRVDSDKKSIIEWYLRK